MLAETALHHTVHGATGPPVLLLHGLGSCAADWAWQIPLLEPAFRVIAVDLPGHGASPVPPSGMTIEDMADDVATPRRGYAAAMRALARFDARGQVAAIRRPTLVVAGDRDTVVPLDAKLRVGAAIPGARVEIVPGSGHATPYDQPAAFNRLLLEFLTSH